MDSRRKSLSQTATVTGNKWSREIHQDAPRYDTLNSYNQDCSSEHNIKFPEERASEESVIDAEEASIDKKNVRNNLDQPSHVKLIPKRNSTMFHEKYQDHDDYSELHVNDATTAMQKLQRLKELQMKRDMSERYYSQEIKRLIREYYFGPRMTSPTLRANGKLESSSFQYYTRDRLKNNLEPCGTITTITRLDCGCIQKTTKPIFTTSRGRVQRRNCSQSEDDVLLKVASLNPPQEHLYPASESRTDKEHVKLKKRLPLDPRMCVKMPSGGDQGFETENEKESDMLESERPEHLSRHSSPRRKFSDTSATSI